MKKINDNKFTLMKDESWITKKYDEVSSLVQKYALVQVNIKNFRYYNTKYGYQGGNEILTLLYEKINETLEDDEYVARVYADNFALLVKYKSAYELLHHRFMKNVNFFYRIDDERINRNLFLSYGIYEIKSGVPFQDAWNAANLVRKEISSSSKRCHSLEFYNEVFYHQYMDRIDLETHTADAYKNYEFFPFYQPKVDPYTNKIIGAEALLRWYDDDKNLVPLDKFLPILNNNSYITLVDLDIFDISCKFLDESIKAGKPVVPLSFNISKSAFYDENIIHDYVEIFEKYDIPKNLIEIELMETISLDDTERMKTIIKAFVDYGFKCILDDFGNGYSSFNVLLNSELSAVKIDRQFFLENLNGDSKLIIKTVINLIKSLHMKVVAEGVEREEHVNYLRECRCDAIQGYYYYKPMTLENFQNLLIKQK